jgi:O-antigen ligase
MGTLRERVLKDLRRTYDMNLRVFMNHPALSWFTMLWIVFCCMGVQQYPSQKTIALLPWVLLLLHGKDGVALLREIVHRYRLATVATCVLAALIFANDYMHGFTKTGLRHLAACVVWLPISALTLKLLRTDRTSPGRFVLLFSVALTIAALVSVIQYVVLQQDRPLGLNHNVHSGTLALLCACAAVAVAALVVCQPPNRAEETSARQIRRVIAVALVAAIFVVVLSGARSPLAAIVVTTLFLTALLRHHVRFAGALAVVLVGGLLVVLGYERSLDIVREVAAYFSGEHATSMGGRLDAWRWFSERGFEAPSLGQSADAVAQSLALRGERWALGVRPMIEMQHLHNDLLQITSAYGVVAALAFVCTLIGFAADSFCEILRGRDQTPFRALLIPTSLVAAPLLVAVAGITDSLTYWSVSWIAWSSAIAVMLAVRVHDTRSYRCTN